MLGLLVAAILTVLFTKKCPPKPKLAWYEKEIVYEIYVPTFQDTNQDGIGDLKGIEKKLDYFEKLNVKSLLLKSSIFEPPVGGRSSRSLSVDTPEKESDLMEINPKFGSNQDYQTLAKMLTRKDMHLIVDLPLSTYDSNSGTWYGMNSSSRSFETNRNLCDTDRNSYGCAYSRFYKRLPLDFDDELVSQTSQDRLRYWLTSRKIDGVRVDLPLMKDYSISYVTIDKWKTIVKKAEKLTLKPKLLLFNIPLQLHEFSVGSKSYLELLNQVPHQLILNNQQQNITAKQLHERFQLIRDNNNLTIPKFWQLGYPRSSIYSMNGLSSEMMLTMGLLFGGTPIVLYGEEIGLEPIEQVGLTVLAHDF
ncbi:unnamed protein product [Didymodactylos carnosus]|uniref:Glycosyl hydrolase family 13 catalytic domain-containing protein n=1 Tax=Didymodactylos carnosus TaxID=1234261 RepID=A0A814Z3U8_9BILA|nr:unnamed protein product [Didymodactylos carnosus]CAF1236799.1 unnamed protein product [Didymodactylos carnosus]CAF1236843.1 unnamed protein product [Didymodactylos carnosus]CAF3654696.1 unnamed protein product [Didymodactylos carnosus]CAF3999144.1 unnamed protein product [Didymodactylos carnosus]